MFAFLNQYLLYLEFDLPKEAKWVLENGSRGWGTRRSPRVARGKSLLAGRQRRRDMGGELPVNVSKFLCFSIAGHEEEVFLLDE